MVAVRYLKQPESLVWTSAGFGKGIGQKDLCGCLTGGIMGLGLAAGQLKTDRKEAKKVCDNLTKEYWEWWKGIAPLHCSEIRTPGTDFYTCLHLGALSAAKVNVLIG